MRKVADLVPESELSALEARFGPFDREHHVLATGALWRRFLADRKLPKRRGEVLFVLRREDGRILLHTKDRYPPGIWRLPTGGLSWDEDIVDALHREVREETGQTIGEPQLLGVLSYAFCGDGKSVPFASFVFVVDGFDGEPEPIDESEGITGFRWVELEELQDAGQRLRELHDPERDWGRFRAQGHDSVTRWLTLRCALSTPA